MRFACASTTVHDHGVKNNLLSRKPPLAHLFSSGRTQKKQSLTPTMTRLSPVRPQNPCKPAKISGCSRAFPHPATLARYLLTAATTSLVVAFLLSYSACLSLFLSLGLIYLAVVLAYFASLSFLPHCFLLPISPSKIRETRNL